MWSKRARAAAFLLAAGLAGPALQAQEAPRPPVVALVAAVGDQLSIVRQKQSVGSNIEPFSRRSLPIKGPALNMAVLQGLNRGVAEEEPQAQRVLLNWTPPAETLQAMAEAKGAARDELILTALREHLGAMPERTQWDRIEAILPRHFRHEIRGMGSRLAGVGIFVQPLKKQGLELTEEGFAPEVGADQGSFRTIDPNTGRNYLATTYVAPYIYFERITLDARSLAVIARRPQFDNIKYHDPHSAATDVSDHMPIGKLLERLLVMAERAAYQSVRGRDKTSSVDTSVPRELPASAPR